MSGFVRLQAITFTQKYWSAKYLGYWSKRGDTSHYNPPFLEVTGQRGI